MALRLTDLARIAGVSIATVSRALNDSPAVQEKTKRRIWKLARENGYVFRPTMPTSLDRAHATISILFPPPQWRDELFSNPFFQELLSSIGEAARKNRCNLILCHTASESYDDLARHMDMSRTDGTIIFGQSFLHEWLNDLMDHGGKFIAWGGDLPGQTYCSVGSDNLRGGYLATSHLIGLGRRKIAYIGETECSEIAQRYQGYKQALEQANIDVDMGLVSPIFDGIENAATAAEKLISRNVDFDGVFCASDSVALGVIRCLTQSGKHVPQDVSVIGYDGIQLARHAKPALSTIDQNLAQAGRLIVSKLINSTTLSSLTSERLPTNVVIRDSCGA